MFRFYLSYFFYKFILLWIEIKTPKLKVFFIEFFYSFGKILKPLEHLAFLIPVDFVKTKFGEFYLRPKTMDIICASPAFERLDVNFLISLIDKLKTQNKKIFFLDIGADIGTYSITLGNKFKKYKKLKIYAFEPNDKSYKLLNINIKKNNLNKLIKPFNFALSNKNSVAYMFNDKLNPGGSKIVNKRGLKVAVKALDSLNIDFKTYNAIIFKMDVEGHEQKILEGAVKSLADSKNLYILLEDFINPSILNFMKVSKFQFITKLTPYNSWWKK